ncbi:MFS transporter [Actinomadura rudentiformis]|uniref:MFS transporter n=1 Tax=Actinomadura rudentiformis TaxID=359158 RepID=A0A6H9Y9J1_9ACTN|nr:MFS transporter [Actinomadura rudentiformis]KAB2340151.1 MFS transporter [Actinomadura rudentiformis]
MRFRTVLAVREFRALWAAELLSQVGDQVARVALAVLVYQRTSSALLAGLAFALTFLPSLLGGVLLGGLADRYPRREVIVVLDLLRAALVGLMALPGMPLAALCALLALVTLLGGPFKAAQLALLADVLTGDRYVTALALRQMTIQSAQVAGFLAGGALAQWISPSGGLAFNAVSFAAAAALVRVGVPRQPAPAFRSAAVQGTARAGGVAMVWRDPGLRSLTALGWLAGFHIVPEAIAAPYADALGDDTAVSVGILMASDPVGSVAGALILGRFVPETVRGKILAPCALLAGLPLLVCAFGPALPLSALMFAMSGALATAYHIQLNAAFVERLHPEAKARGLGVLASGLITVQGLGALGGGLFSDLLGPERAIALAGISAILLGLRPAATWIRVSGEPRTTAPDQGP